MQVKVIWCSNCVMYVMGFSFAFDEVVCRKYRFYFKSIYFDLLQYVFIYACMYACMLFQLKRFEILKWWVDQWWLARVDIVSKSVQKGRLRIRFWLRRQIPVIQEGEIRNLVQQTTSSSSSHSSSCCLQRMAGLLRPLIRIMLVVGRQSNNC
jgi:hypothetical protein